MVAFGRIWSHLVAFGRILPHLVALVKGVCFGVGCAIFIFAIFSNYMLSVEYQKARFPNLSLLSSQYEKTEDEEEHDYDPFSLITLQHYNPLYALLFNPSVEHQNRITLATKYYFHDLQHVTDAKGKLYEKPVFIKFSPLLDPIRFLIGKYDDAPLSLPYITSGESLLDNSQKGGKLNDINNSSYVDSFFNYLNGQLKEKHNFIHGLDYYGSFLCIQNKYKFNITDDLEYLVSSKHFIDTYDKIYTIEKFSKNELVHLFKENNGIAEKERLAILDEPMNGDLLEILHIESLEPLDTIDEVPIEEEMSMKELTINENELEIDVGNDINNGIDGSDDDDDDDSSLNYTTDEEPIGDKMEYCDGADVGDDGADVVDDGDEGEEEEGEEEEEEEEEGEEEEQLIGAYIKDFPIQMICLEKCEGTFDELFQEGQIDEKSGSSALFQIVMTLLIYQATFNMTHNDLHTNNIMYINTPEKFIYYYYDGKFYKVPTFGRIFKIIDFGRAIYTYNGHTFCSDSFAPKGDAHTQYNCEPYYNPQKKQIEPNPSFDLCRLGASIYDFIISDEDEENPKKMDSFQQTIYRWCHDDNGKNVLYKSDGSERYPNFSLYKMLSRTVHNHIPKNEIKKYRIFNQYEVKTENVKTVMNKMNTKFFINVDRIPSYVGLAGGGSRTDTDL